MSNQRFRGHPIFHNQPPPSYYDKSFEDTADTFYLHLNDIDPYFLLDGLRTHEELLKGQDEDAEFVIKDPRTKQNIETYNYDHTDSNCKIEMFNFPFNSILSIKQHAAGIRVLKAWQQCIEVNEDDMIIWCKMAKYLQSERARMAKFVRNYAQTHQAKIYAPTQRLVKLYQQWYSKQLSTILKRFSKNSAYNTTAGLPHVRVCKPLRDELRAKIGNIHSLHRRGFVRVHEPWHINYKVLQVKLESYAEAYVETAKTEHFTRNEINQIWEEIDNDIGDQSQTLLKRCFIPLESLLFLLLSGEIVDLPTEMLLRLEIDDEGYKIVYFEEPLPARNCGWHTHQQIVQQAHDMQLCLDNRILWLKYLNTVEKVTLERLDAVNINAALNDAEKEATSTFKAHKFEEYFNLHASKITASAAHHHLKTNETLIAWQLQTYVDDVDDKAQKVVGGFQMLTNLYVPVSTSTTGQHFYASNSIKLEYKASMGCEVLTKYELMKHWFQLRLLETNDTRQEPTRGLCTRLCCESFELLLTEQLTRGQIEQQLYEQHQLRMPNLLVKLHEFLQLLGNMPIGEYMLRHSFNHNDKFLLCAPTHEITSNTVVVPNLIQVVPSDLYFMTSESMYLPLAESLVSRVHSAANVMPCTFAPMKDGVKKTKFKNLEKTAYFNDREHILLKVKKQQANLKEQKIARCKKNRQMKKARKRKVKKQLKQKETEEHEELEKDMHNDEILFGLT